MFSLLFKYFFQGPSKNISDFQGIPVLTFLSAVFKYFKHLNHFVQTLLHTLHTLR